jgi:hypothetical protein
MRRLRLVVLAIAALMLGPVPGIAQIGVGPSQPSEAWETVETENFRVHFPTMSRDWTLPLVERMEAYHEAVAQMVGRAPDRTVTVLVADPTNQSNGYALGLIDHPLTTLWPTPPGPRAGIGHHSGWGELLFVHEYAHLAHLTYPSRNWGERSLWSLSPLRSGPVARRSPRWVVEGYATYLEGVLTGSGRPYGVSRPAFLRLRALEGRLPSYGEMSGASGYQDMGSAYMAGSAYLEWLVVREGEESLTDLWHRMSARERRDFSSAFRGVYGGPPEELYGRFTVDLTAGALEARNRLEAEGIEEGEPRLVRRWHTGDPALSPDGERVALELHSRDAPPILTILGTEEDEDAAEERARARERLVERDPLDVPAVEPDPPPLPVKHRLEARSGRPFLSPRFFADGQRVLTVRWEPRSDGTLRPDLFIWTPDEGGVERVTFGAGVRDADPSPDAERAVGVRCDWGSCDLVLVSLSSGEISTLAAGSPDRTFHRPRWTPDGLGVVAALQEEGRWRVIHVPVDGAAGSGATSALRYLDPDDGASRYDPVPLPHGRGVAVVSEATGVANLELLPLEATEGAEAPRGLTRVLGAVAAPEPDPATGALYFLNLHSRGWDLHRLHPDSIPAVVGLAPDPGLWPVLPRSPSERPTPPSVQPAPSPEPYGWGPQRWNLVPGGGWDAGGGSAHLSVYMGDPVGRLSLVAQGQAGDPGTWRGGGVSALIRRLPVDLRLEGFSAARENSVRGEAIQGSARLQGGLAGLDVERWTSAGRLHARALGGSARLSLPGSSPEEGDEVNRTAGIAEGGAAFDLRRGDLRLRPSVQLHMGTGRTGDRGWSRFRADTRLELAVGRVGLSGDLGYGRLDGEASFERFQVGGTDPSLVDPAFLSQLISLPALPPGLLEGRRLGMGRLSLEVAGASPFLQVVSVDPSWSRWHRVAGLEQGLALPSASQVALPELSFRFGLARSLDAPFEDRTRGWITATIRP